MKILGVIPARYASTRFPGKPLADIVGKPMIQWVYERASKVFNHLYVATDDQRILYTVNKFGGNVVMTSSEHHSGTDRCAEALDTIERENRIHFDIVANIQGDEPFIEPNQLKLLLKPFEKSEVQISTLVKTFAENEDVFNSNKPKVVFSKDKKALFFSRSVIPFIRGVQPNAWMHAHPFYKHIGLYAFRTNVLRMIAKLEQSPLELSESLEQLRWLENGFQIHVEITHQETISIDSPEDLEKAMSYFEKKS